MEKDEAQRDIKHFVSKEESSGYFNQLLHEVHQKELNIRKNIPRPFKISDDINSNPYCQIFKGKEVEISGSPVYVATTNEVKVGGKLINHTFLINSEGSIIDPTFGQHLISTGVDPVKFRRDNPDLFVDGVFYGKSSDVEKVLGERINYFPKRIIR